MRQRLPVLAMYAGSVPQAAIESGLLHRFEKILLDESAEDGGGDQRLALYGRQRLEMRGPKYGNTEIRNTGNTGTRYIFPTARCATLSH